MGTLGISELFLIVLIVGLLYVPFYLRKKFPMRIWLSVILGFIYPWGQFYIKKNSIVYVIGLVILAFFLNLFLSELIAVIILDLIGAIIGYYRVNKEIQISALIENNKRNHLAS